MSKPCAVMAIGIAVHEAKDRTLRSLYPGRFKYSSNNGIDFIDRTTGEIVESTTEREVASKMQKYNVTGNEIAT